MCGGFPARGVSPARCAPGGGTALAGEALLQQRREVHDVGGALRRLESLGLGHQRWRARGSLSAFDPA